MLIQRTQIRSLDRHFDGTKAGQQIVLGVRDVNGRSARLREIGFSANFEAGERVLPPASLGPTSLRNAEGWDIVHKDRPMETAYRLKVWRWTQWRGRYDGEEHSKIVQVPYKRYPRTHYAPARHRAFHRHHHGRGKGDRDGRHHV